MTRLWRRARCLVGRHNWHFHVGVAGEWSACIDCGITREGTT